MASQNNNKEMSAESRAELIDYLSQCFSENLNHARHVENERLTFTSIYIAMVIGAVAVVFGLENNWVAFFVALLLTVFAVIAFVLNLRWQGIFDKHKAKVKTCEKQWCHLIGKGEDTFGGYYYGKYYDQKDDKFKGLTKWIFYILYGTILAALILLTAYLLSQAKESATGGGFYFSVEARKELENALTHIVKEALK